MEAEPSTDAKAKALRKAKAETKQAARDAMPDYAERARRMAGLAAAPALPLADVALWLDLPLSTLEKLRAAGKAPKCFTLGRRRYVRQVDLRDWLDAMAASEAA